MKRLNRHDTPPECLACYDYKSQTWDDFSSEHKREIWLQLDSMQKEKCAYCEVYIRQGKRHIEHFRRKSLHTALTFAWSNLLGCCRAIDSCGHHKDKKGWPYDIADLIDPTNEDPDDFFYFRTDGSIDVRSCLPEKDARRASETLRVLNLNRGPLRKRRNTAVRVYLEIEPGILQALMDFEPEEAHQFAAEEISRVEDDELSTPIRHLFLDFLSAT